MRRCRLLRATLVLLPAFGSSLAAQTAREDARDVQPGSAVRAADPDFRRLIELGVARSPTFRRVVAELDASDVIVQVVRRRLPDRHRGYLSHAVSATKDVRYLWISIDPRGADQRVVALLAHELQHALEVARVAEVGRSRTVEDLFHEIADQPCTVAHCFETSTAIEVQEAVLRELD